MPLGSFYEPKHIPMGMYLYEQKDSILYQQEFKELPDEFRTYSRFRVKLGRAKTFIELNDYSLSDLEEISKIINGPQLSDKRPTIDSIDMNFKNNKQSNNEMDTDEYQDNVQNKNNKSISNNIIKNSMVKYNDHENEINKNYEINDKNSDEKFYLNEMKIPRNDEKENENENTDANGKEKNEVINDNIPSVMIQYDSLKKKMLIVTLKLVMIIKLVLKNL